MVVSTNDGPSPQVQQYYTAMSAARRRLVGPLAVFTAAYYLVMNVLAGFTSFLDGIVFAGMSGAYLFAFSQMVVCVVVTLIYRRRIDAVDRRYRPAELDHAPAVSGEEATA